MSEEEIKAFEKKEISEICKSFSVNFVKGLLIGCCFIFLFVNSKEMLAVSIEKKSSFFSYFWDICKILVITGFTVYLTYLYCSVLNNILDFKTLSRFRREHKEETNLLFAFLGTMSAVLPVMLINLIIAVIDLF